MIYTGSKTLLPVARGARACFGVSVGSSTRRVGARRLRVGRVLGGGGVEEVAFVLAFGGERFAGFLGGGDPSGRGSLASSRERFLLVLALVSFPEPAGGVGAWSAFCGAFAIWAISATLEPNEDMERGLERGELSSVGAPAGDFGMAVFFEPMLMDDASGGWGSGVALENGDAKSAGL